MKVSLIFFLFIGISCAMTGIDVSTTQNWITWSKVVKYKYFAIIRAGYGLGYMDDYYDSNYLYAKDAGVRVGAYWYSYARSASDAVKEANFCVQALRGRTFEWPIYYYIEEQSIFDAGIASDIAKAFCEVLEANKYFCGIYSSASALNTYFDSYTKETYTIWVSDLDKDVPAYNGTYDVWQYKVDYVEGIKGQVALDYGYIDFEPIMKENHLNGY